VAGLGSVDSISKVPTTSRPAAAKIPNPQERVPVLPVLAFVFGYIMLGATIFSAWENWSFLEGAYFSFITLTTIGFGDFVPGDAVLNDESEQGQAKLILACIYLLMGLAILAMSINLVQVRRPNACATNLKLGLTSNILTDQHNIHISNCQIVKMF
jgi:hypothetical protein